MKRNFVLAYILMLICSAAAGVASGILYFDTMGIRGAVLGISLALGIIVVNMIEHKRFIARESPRKAVVLSAAILSGLVGGVLVNFYGMGLTEPRHYDFGPDPTPAGLQTISVSIIYGILLQGAYSLRWRFSDEKKMRFFSTLGFFVLAGVITTIARVFIKHHNLEAIGVGLLESLLTGIPFALLWGASVALTDPAWSHEKFEKMNV